MVPRPLSQRPADVAYMAFFAVLFLGIVLVDGQTVFPGMYPTALQKFWVESSKSLPHPLQIEGMTGGATFYRLGIMGPALFVIAPVSLWLIAMLYLESPAINLPGLVVAVHVLTNMVVADSDVLLGNRPGLDVETRLKCLATHIIPYVATTLFAIRCAGRLKPVDSASGESPSKASGKSK